MDKIRTVKKLECKKKKKTLVVAAYTSSHLSGGKSRWIAEFEAGLVKE